MTTKLILICTLLLSGCVVSQNQIDKATELCKDNGGIKIIPGMVRADVVDVVCNNSAEFNGAKVQND